MEIGKCNKKGKKKYSTLTLTVLIIQFNGVNSRFKKLDPVTDQDAKLPKNSVGFLHLN